MDLIGEKLEVSLIEQEMQLELYPKGHPIMGFVRDPKRINVSLHEEEQKLDIELNHQEVPFAFS